MHKNILMIEKIIDHYIVFMCFINCVDFKHLKKKIIIGTFVNQSNKARTPLPTSFQTYDVRNRTILKDP